jgi:hypothetical protein
MNTTKILILAGAAALILGAFLPIVGDSVGSATMWTMGPPTATGWIFFGALIAGGLALANRVRYAIWPALATFAGLIGAFIGLKGDMDRFNANEPPAEHVAQFQWLGWAVLAVGVILVMIASFRVLSDPDEPEEG